MELVPNLTLRPAPEVSPGSLVMLHQSGDWAISAGEEGLFTLKKLLSEPSSWNGLVLDAGDQYQVRIRVLAPKEIAYPFGETAILPVKGALCLFNGRSPSVCIGASNDVLCVLELEHGKTREVGSSVGPGVGFRALPCLPRDPVHVRNIFRNLCAEYTHAMFHLHLLRAYPPLRH